MQPISHPRSIRRILLLAGAAGLTLASHLASAQIFLLEEYLPYQSDSTSAFSSSSGLSLTFGGTSESDFFWQIVAPEGSTRTNFRLDASGLVVLSDRDTSVEDPDSTQTYNPVWNVAPASVSAGQTINSTANLSGTEQFRSWTGDVTGTLSVGSITSVTTPAGTFEALPLTLKHTWNENETGSSYTATGMVTQTWSLVRYVGVAKVDYSFSESDSEGDSDSGSFSFVLTSSSNLALPTITTQPQAQSVTRGSNVNFSVVATGPGVLTYQWQKGIGQPISGATEANLTLNDIQEDDAGNYSVVITNFRGKITSAEALLTVTPPVNGITIPDANLEAGLRSALSKPIGEITTADMAQLVTFTWNSQNVTDLTGLEHAVNLTSLTLVDNNISDLSPLEDLAELTQLNLSVNQINDLSPLVGLTKLWLLRLTNNDISDISPFSQMPSLINVTVSTNAIEDLSPLTDLPNLRAIDIQSNFLTDLTAIANLSNLQTVLLGANYLDVSAGSATRQIIDKWISEGATVLFEPQLTPPSTDLGLTIVSLGSQLQLNWRSQNIANYRLFISTNLTIWTDAEIPPFEGTGNPMSTTVPINSLDKTFYRLHVTPKRP